MQSGSINQPKLNKMISLMEILKLITSLQELIDLIVVQSNFYTQQKDKKITADKKKIFPTPGECCLLDKQIINTWIQTKTIWSRFFKSFKTFISQTILMIMIEPIK